MPQTDLSSDAPTDALTFCYRHPNSLQFTIMFRLMYAHKYVSMNTNFKFNAIVGHMRLDSRRIMICPLNCSRQIIWLQFFVSFLLILSIIHTFNFVCNRTKQLNSCGFIRMASRWVFFSFFFHPNNIISSNFKGIQTENCQKIKHSGHTDHTDDVDEKSWKFLSISFLWKYLGKYLLITYRFSWNCKWINLP